MSVSMRQLVNAGVHFGHQTRHWNPKMQQYIYDTRNRVHIINLDIALPKMKQAMSFVHRLSARNGKVLFIGTKYAASAITREQALRCGMPYVDYRWLGGMLTNWKTIKKSIAKLGELQQQRDDGTFDKLVKKEQLTRLKEMEKLERSLGGIQHMGSLPDALFIMDVGHEKIAVQEAKKLGIPIIGVVDTNNDPDEIDYIIPGNDDSIRSLNLYATLVADTILKGQESRGRQSDNNFADAESDAEEYND